MIDDKKCRDELAKGGIFPPSSAQPYAVMTAVNTATLDALWKVARAARKLVVRCNHKPEGWDDVDKALAALEEK